MSATGPAAPDHLRTSLDETTFARLIDVLGPFEDRPRLAVAVSGGPDSLALTLLAARWAGKRSGSLVGVTVDHGLRPASGDEARMVGEWLQRRGIAHVILPWRGAKPKSGIQAAAREVRYRLLGDFCRRTGILHLLLAHHRGDQAETVALRSERKSGADGLAGMPAITERSGFRLLRPLLGVAKSELEATLRAHGQAWLDDPSNRDLAFARGRLRAAGGSVTLPASGARGRSRAARERDLARWLALHVRIDPLGFVDLDRRAFEGAPADIAGDALRRALLTVGGERYPPAPMALERLRDRLGRGRPATLAGALVQVSGRTLRVLREARAWRGPAVPLENEVWLDHRFLITCLSPRPGLTAALLGERGWLERRRLAQVRAAPRVERAVGEALPALLHDGALVAVPQLGLAGPDALPPDAVRVRFRPRHPLAGAPFGAVIG